MQTWDDVPIVIRATLSPYAIADKQEAFESLIATRVSYDCDYQQFRQKYVKHLIKGFKGTRLADLYVTFFENAKMRIKPAEIMPLLSQVTILGQELDAVISMAKADGLDDIVALFEMLKA
jgi:hypothetical protein